MTTIHLKKLDDVNMYVDCDRSTAYEMSDFFSFKAPGFFFHPLYKAGVWDGVIRIFNAMSKKLYIGLLDHVEYFAKSRGYELIVDPDIMTVDEKITPEFTKEFTDKLNAYAKDKTTGKWSPIKARDYQLYALYDGLRFKRTTLVSPTASGKSYIIYGLTRYVQTQIPKDKKTLIIVPTIGLVTQMKEDFKEYSYKNGWDADEEMHLIHGGQDKHTEKGVVVSTWQSIYKMGPKYFKQFGAIIGDECHLFKAKSLTTIMDKLFDCPYRIGLTGTLGSKTVHKLVLEGLFGRSKKYISTKQLMDRKEVADLTIKPIVLKYPDDDKKGLRNFKTKIDGEWITKKATYQEELKFILEHKKRNKFIVNLTHSLSENTLILFSRNDHGKLLRESIAEKLEGTGRKIYFVNGGTSKDDREKVRLIVEKEKNCVIIASYGVFSTGISIKNIHNVIFAAPSKSEFRVLQSIGRGLRVSATKLKVVLWDIVDDLSWKKTQNYALKHFLERMKIYTAEKFKYKMININL